jgi:hypothetical protein
MPTCTGCNPVINGRAVPISGPATVLFTGALSGNGWGIFSGITGLPLANLVWSSTSGANGKCTGFTGRFEASAIVTGGSGIFSWNGTAYTCTGMGSCREQFSITATVHPIIQTTFPNYQMWVSLYSPAPGSSIGTITQLNQNTTSSTLTWGFSTPCNSTIPIYQEVRFIPIISGFGPSGRIEGVSPVIAGCTACIQGA